MPRRVIEVKAFMRAARVELAATLAKDAADQVPIEATIAIGEIVLPVRFATIGASPDSPDPVLAWPPPRALERVVSVVRLTLEIEGATLHLRDDAGTDAIIVDGDVARLVTVRDEREHKPQ